MTSLMTSTLRLSGYLEPTQLPISEQVKFALTANISIVGMNISLMWNSVGFYQVRWHTVWGYLARLFVFTLAGLSKKILTAGMPHLPATAAATRTFSLSPAFLS